MQKIIVKTKINSPCVKVRSILWEIKYWTNFWIPTHNVNVLYDDTLHQDFSMSLDWQTSSTYIRTVRFLNEQGNITFFSPTPPPPMTLHQGLWELTPENDQITELTAIRFFTIPLSENETLKEYEKRLNDFSQGFVVRLEKLLKCLGELCESST